MKEINDHYLLVICRGALMKVLLASCLKDAQEFACLNETMESQKGKTNVLYSYVNVHPDLTKQIN